MNKKLVAICEGVLLIVIGVLIAVFGGREVMDIVFGVLFVIAGAALGTLASLVTIKSKVLPLGLTFAAVASLFFGIMLLASRSTVEFFIHYAMIAAFGLGVALFLKGLHIIIVRKLVFTGLGQMVIGAAVSTVSMLYLFPPEGFYKVFWIVVGVLVAVYGAYACAVSVFSKEAK